MIALIGTIVWSWGGSFVESVALTPTEAAVVAVACGVFIGMVIYHSIGFRDLFRLLIDAGELSAVVLMITSRIAGIGMEETFRWVIWLVLAMSVGLAAMIMFPQIMPEELAVESCRHSP